jgi:hypothetical protein
LTGRLYLTVELSRQQGIIATQDSLGAKVQRHRKEAKRDLMRQNQMCGYSLPISA